MNTKNIFTIQKKNPAQLADIWFSINDPYKLKNGQWKVPLLVRKGKDYIHIPQNATVQVKKVFNANPLQDEKDVYIDLTLANLKISDKPFNKDTLEDFSKIYIEYEGWRYRRVIVNVRFYHLQSIDGNLANQRVFDKNIQLVVNDESFFRSAFHKKNKIKQYGVFFVVHPQRLILHSLPRTHIKSDIVAPKGVASVTIGSDHNDLLIGSADNNGLYGGKGNDVMFDASGGNDVFDGGLHNDTLSSDSLDELSPNVEKVDNLNKMRGGPDHIDPDNDIDGDDIHGSAGREIIFGGADVDYINGKENDDEIHGGSGNDDLSGQKGDDILYGDEDDDVLHGGQGFDYLDGGTGHDKLYGGKQGDILLGGMGNDTLRGDDGDDVLWGGSGINTHHGGRGNDTFIIERGINEYRDQRRKREAGEFGTYVLIGLNKDVDEGYHYFKDFDPQKDKLVVHTENQKDINVFKQACERSEVYFKDGEEYIHLFFKKQHLFFNKNSFFNNQSFDSSKLFQAFEKLETLEIDPRPYLSTPQKCYKNLVHYLQQKGRDDRALSIKNYAWNIPTPSENRDELIELKRENNIPVNAKDRLEKPTEFTLVSMPMDDDMDESLRRVYLNKYYRMPTHKPVTFNIFDDRYLFFEDNTKDDQYGKNIFLDKRSLLYDIAAMEKQSELEESEDFTIGFTKNPASDIVLSDASKNKILRYFDKIVVDYSVQEYRENHGDLSKRKNFKYQLDIVTKERAKLSPLPFDAYIKYRSGYVFSSAPIRPLIYYLDLKTMLDGGYVVRAYEPSSLADHPVFKPKDENYVRNMVTFRLLNTKGLSADEIIGEKQKDGSTRYRAKDPAIRKFLDYAGVNDPRRPFSTIASPPVAMIYKLK